MDRPNPEPPEHPPIRPAAAGPDDPPGAAAAPGPRRPRAEARLRARAGGGPIVAWTRAWVSRDQRLHRLFAARTLDVVVLTDDELAIVSMGFFTRRPRRRVFAAPLERLTVVDVPVGRGRRLVVTGRDAPIRIELRANRRAHAFADALVARAQRVDAARAGDEPAGDETEAR